MDRLASERDGVPVGVLMENAGRSVAQAVWDLMRGRSSRVLVLCGQGNNGGDGLVAARHLLNRGVPVDTVLVGRPEKLSLEARTNWDLVQRLSGSVSHIVDVSSLSALADRIRQAEVVVDALLGIGVRGELREPLRSVIAAVNRAGRPVVAVDLPSGLDADTGMPHGEAIRACRTVTLGAVKRGLAVGAGPEVAGEVWVGEVGWPLNMEATS
jgi:NAD(P)H-hydrate epimerase